MSERILFVSPANLYPVDKDGRPMQQVRQNVSLPALTVLGSLKSEGFDVDFMDLAADGYDERTQINENVCRFGLPDDTVVQRISETKPFALLVTSMFTTEQKMVDDLAAKVKEACPELPIIVGGAHATLKPDWLLNRNIDFIILGEGEETAPELLKSLNAGNLESIDEILFKLREPLKDLNRAWAFDEVLLKEGNYRYNDINSRRSRIYAHMTKPEWTRSFSLYYSRGCPTHCEYCASSEKDGFKIRHMGSERMFSDFRLLHEKYGVNIFYNQADTFGLSEEDIKFLRRVKDYRKQHPDFVLNNPNAFPVRMFFPPENNYELDENLLDLFANAGFNVMTLAVETFNHRFNKKIDFNNIPPEKMKEMFAAIHKKGMKTELYMMYAFPGQTREELLNDEKIVSSFSDVDEVAWQSCMIFPGTEYFREILRLDKCDELLYKQGLNRGYFFHHMPQIFDFSDIPISESNSFRNRHPPNL